MPTTKVCDRCGQPKPATSQYFAYDTNEALKPICRECGYAIAAERRQRKNEQSRQWARSNPEKVRESQRRAYEKNRGERLAYMRRWREQNKERINEYQRAYHQRKSQ